jgi:hypothetical protein
MALAAQPYAQFEVMLTPLINEEEDAITTGILYPTQIYDVRVTHPLGEGRTASVTLSMFDPVVDGLVAFAFALRILYYKPGESGGEPVFWGQSNLTEDYAAGTVTLDAQDPSLRAAHHYLRFGDEALNDIKDPQKGTIHPDKRGLQLLVDASIPNVTGSGPSMGWSLRDEGSVNTSKNIDVERGQELWQLIQDISSNELGPDIDMEVAPDMSSGRYCQLVTYVRLGRELMAVVSFDYGEVSGSLDNLKGLTVSPSHPSTYVTIVDSVQKWRVNGRSSAAFETFGMFVDWIMADFKVAGSVDDADVLLEQAKAHIRAFAYPLSEVSAELRSGAQQTYFYGCPNWTPVAGATVGDFYVGDVISLRALRGYRSTTEEQRITAVELQASGSRGPVTTSVTMVPHGSSDIDVTLEVDAN